MKVLRPQYGGPYRVVPKYDALLDIKKLPLPDIDRSGTKALDSYELGYLRDSMQELENRQMEIEANQRIMQQARQIAAASGIPARDLVAGTRAFRSQRQARQFQMTPRSSQLPFFTSMHGLASAQTIANPVGEPLDQMVSDREAAQYQREMDLSLIHI